MLEKTRKVQCRCTQHNPIKHLWIRLRGLEPLTSALRASEEIRLLVRCFIELLRDVFTDDSRCIQSPPHEILKDLRLVVESACGCAVMATVSSYAGETVCTHIRKVLIENA